MNILSMLRWLLRFGFRFPDTSRNNTSNAECCCYNSNDVTTKLTTTSSLECHVCTQVGVPIFHSTTCDGAHQPSWHSSAGSSLTRPDPNFHPTRTRNSFTGTFGTVLDPRSKWVKEWNKILLLTRGVSMAVDPLFFYALSLTVGKGGGPCLYVDNTVAAIVTVARTCVDAVQVWHVWVQLRMAYVSRESLVVGCGKLVWDARAIARHYVRSMKGFWLDVFVILPVPQAIFWLLVPKLIEEEKIKVVLTVLLIFFLFQFLPKVYHSLCLMSRMRKVTGYIFGTIWWGFGLNLVAYLIASHATGGCWYVLAVQSVVSCLKKQCERNSNCVLSMSCSKDVCYQFMYPAEVIFGNLCSTNSTIIAKPMCLDDEGPFNYGIYSPALLVVSSNSPAVKILYPIFWGLLNLSTFGNELAPTSDLTEVIFSISIVLCGLCLFTLLIGNIQVFLHVVMAKKKKMQLRGQDIEWWMKRRQLPSGLRQRVRHFERQRWIVTGGEDESRWIEELPEGLRRDIKRYLCLDLIKKVPMFDNLDDRILDNICDRVKPLIFSKDEKIIREGDPVQRLVFIVRGRIQRYQRLSKGMVAASFLEPGGFLGDELLSWCLRRPFMDRLPASSATFVCVKATEAFSLDDQNLRYITEHFRYTFGNERLKRTMRYYSSNWRTWAAVNIQFAWRKYRTRTTGSVTPVTVNGGFEKRLRHYAVMFMSIRTHDHLE